MSAGPGRRWVVPGSVSASTKFNFETKKSDFSKQSCTPCAWYRRRTCSSSGDFLLHYLTPPVLRSGRLLTQSSRPTCVFGRSDGKIAIGHPQGRCLRRVWRFISPKRQNPHDAMIVLRNINKTSACSISGLFSGIHLREPAPSEESTSTKVCAWVVRFVHLETATGS